MNSFHLFARNTNIAPPSTPTTLRLSLAQTTQALNNFPNYSTRSSDTYYIPLNKVLFHGEALVKHWDLLRGCTVTDTHLDARM